MKIGFVLYDYFPFGGLQRDCLATALATANRGHEVHVFTRTWKGERPDAIKVHILGKKGWTNTSRNDRFFSALEQELPKYLPEGIVAFSRIPKADIYFAADPCYAECVKDKSVFYKFRYRHRYYKALEKTVFTAMPPPYTLVLTEREIKAFQRHYGIDRNKFHLLPPGIERNTASRNTAKATRNAVRNALGVAEDATVALFVGSGFRIKGLDRALKALAANQSAAKTTEFWIVGNGKPARFQKLAKRAGIPVRFLGGRTDVARFYDAADFLLHPAYNESAGKVLIEALTHGLPVLTTDTCGYAPHVLKAEAGAVIPAPFDQEALNRTLHTFIQDGVQRSRMSQNALAYAAREDLYSCHRVAAEQIERVLSQNRKLLRTSSIHPGIKPVATPFIRSKRNSPDDSNQTSHLAPIFELTDELRDALPKGVDPFEYFLQGSGEVHRHVKNRLTYEVRSGGLHFYVKRHLGCGWGEVFKEWYRFRKPVVSARTEWEGVAALAAAGVRVPKVLGKGERGYYPHAVESFVVLEALEDCDTLEYFKHGWMDYTGTRWVSLKRTLIDEVARMGKAMHGRGINHRDFYINHFLINRDLIRNWRPGQGLPLYLIDLHRVQHRSRVPKRWLIKDLASLLFSALDTGMTSADYLRFLKTYLGVDWKQSLQTDRKLWQAILRRACKLYENFHGKAPLLPKILQL